MRWNCPHCEKLVTAGIDFESTKKAYVRCAGCGGMALIHRSAVLADYVKARRMEEEAQLEFEIRLQQELKQRQALQLELAEAERAALRAAADAEAARTEANAATSAAANANPARLAAPSELATDDDDQMLATAVITETANAAAILVDEPRVLAATPPAQLHEANIDGMLLAATPFVQASIRREETPPLTPPPFLHASPTAPRPLPVPPAFLVGNVEDAIRAFATDDEPATPIAAKTPTRSATLASSVAVWAAAAMALASGIYLYLEGRAAFAPTPAETVARIEAPAADRAPAAAIAAPAKPENSAELLDRAPKSSAMRKRSPAARKARD